MSNGVLIIDKPQDFTSFDVCALLRGLLRTKKIGHAGTLDPMATGVLPVFVGKATKAIELLPVHGKEYETSFRLGICTTTQDIWGEITKTAPFSVTREQLEAVLPEFRGDIMQTPPMYSAVSVDGKRLYELARKGVEIDRPARQITIEKLELMSFDEKTGEGTLRCACSKGTYIRTLVADIGDRLGCGAAITALRRTVACGYSLENAVTIEEARRLKEEGTLEDRLLSMESAFTGYRCAVVTDNQTVRVKNGGALALDRIKPFEAKENGEYVRIKSRDGEFLAIGMVSLDDSELKIKKPFWTE